MSTAELTRILKTRDNRRRVAAREKTMSLACARYDHKRCGCGINAGCGCTCHRRKK